MTRAPERVLCRVRAEVGAAGLERLTPDQARDLLAEVLFPEGIAEWRRLAACIDENPARFYPEPGADIARRVSEAKQVCAGCPVRVECLIEVMATEPPAHRYGVAGGFSANECRHLWALHRTTGGEVA